MDDLNLLQYDDEGIFPGGRDMFNGDYGALQRLAGGMPLSIGLRANVNNRYVVPENAGSSRRLRGDPVQCQRTLRDGRERRSSALIANRALVGDWERFQIVNNADGSLSLRANANGRYVTAENAGSSPLIANRTAIGLWEKFTQVGPSTVISLRADVNNRYVVAENSGGSPPVANRTAIGTWEQFDLLDVGAGDVALRSRANGLYVTAENAGSSPLIANRTAVNAWERFQLVGGAAGSFAPRANANGRFVTAENAVPCR